MFEEGGIGASSAASMRVRIRRVLFEVFGRTQQPPVAAFEPTSDLPRASAALAATAEPVTHVETVRSEPGPPTLDAALAVPFDYQPRSPTDPRPIAVLIHLYYEDLASEIFRYLRNIPVRADVFVTTDTAAKRAAILRQMREWDAGRMEVRVVPNRGRDIAPKLVGMADVHRNYDRVLHLHGKKSDHWQHGQDWRRYLYEVLLGTPDVVRSMLAAFDSDPCLGMILPQHWDPVRSAVDWGFDYRACRSFGQRLGLEVSRDQPLEFPSGSMFWARSAALQPLLDLGLSFDDFPAEGFTGGTLAHVIERLYVRVCERSGHTWVKAARPDLSEDPAGIVRIADPDALHDFLLRRPYLLGDAALRKPPDPALLPTSTPRPRWRFLPGRTSRPRLTLLASGTPAAAPTRPGGTLDMFRRVAVTWGDADLRVVGSPSYLLAARDALAGPGLPRPELVPALPAAFPPAPLEMRAHEVLFGAAWRDSADARTLLESQESFFGGRSNLVHLLLDGEADDVDDPCDRLAEAEACRHSLRSVAVLATPMLAARLQERGYAFARREVLLPLWDTALDSALLGPSSEQRAPVLLVEWLPSRADALAGLAAAAIGRWLEEDPQTGRQWEICGFGEAGPDVVVAAGRVLRNLGPLGAEDYAAQLRRARLGMSLRLSGVPSRAALEMAACGATTVVAPCGPALAFPIRLGDGLHGTCGLDVNAVAAALARAAAGKSGRPASRPGGTPAGFWSDQDMDALAYRISAWTWGGAPQQYNRSDAAQ